jgi:hypothetical protein
LGLKDKKLGAESSHSVKLDEGDQILGSAHGEKGAKEKRSIGLEKALVERAEKM